MTKCDKKAILIFVRETKTKSKVGFFQGQEIAAFLMKTSKKMQSECC